ncbi:uncharacterized protein LOC129597767 isoform X2 [Paramacrobiotus metropolitanus]|uniref:uncharacterized protein LOC129597767 isoform X2 n=1 Tax=Paramacrobiotus metropolitanus TaxID=2943436 RepID=UPI002445E38A|nr:uncharacterized protein LOC129597767 isoform X2 [Paramacrobiotus metropolitanus]
MSQSQKPDVRHKRGSWNKNVPNVNTCSVCGQNPTRNSSGTSDLMVLCEGPLCKGKPGSYARSGWVHARCINLHTVQEINLAPPHFCPLCRDIKAQIAPLPSSEFQSSSVPAVKSSPSASQPFGASSADGVCSVVHVPKDTISTQAGISVSTQEVIASVGESSADYQKTDIVTSGAESVKMDPANRSQTTRPPSVDPSLYSRRLSREDVEKVIGFISSDSSDEEDDHDDTVKKARMDSDSPMEKTEDCTVKEKVADPNEERLVSFPSPKISGEMKVEEPCSSTASSAPHTKFVRARGKLASHSRQLKRAVSRESSVNGTGGPEISSMDSGECSTAGKSDMDDSVFLEEVAVPTRPSSSPASSGEVRVVASEMVFVDNVAVALVSLQETTAECVVEDSVTFESIMANPDSADDVRKFLEQCPELSISDLETNINHNKQLKQQVEIARKSLLLDDPQAPNDRQDGSVG